MDCVSLYKKRIGINGIVEPKLRLIYEARKNFERSLKKDPCSKTLRITDVGEVNIKEDTKLVQCIVNDFSKNDQKTLDEKMIYVRYDENVGIGSYVEFDNFIWLVIFKEHRSIDAYKIFVMRKCNQILRYDYLGEIHSIPCIVKNLTQYSDGLQDIVYTSTPDSRRSIMYSQNAITSNIKLGHRFLINNSNAYRVTHIQDFEYQDTYGSNNGIASCIAVHTSLLGDDDIENNLAANKENSEIQTRSLNRSFKTEESLMVGSSVSYKVEEEGCIWEIEYISNNSNYVNISSSDKKCHISLDMDFDLIGENFKLRALNSDNNVILEKNITVVGFM